MSMRVKERQGHIRRRKNTLLEILEESCEQHVRGAKTTQKTNLPPEPPSLAANLCRLIVIGPENGA